jgi:hypothetical protein
MDSASKCGAIFLREGKWDGSNLGSQEWSWSLADKSKPTSIDGFMNIKSKKVNQKSFSVLPEPVFVRLNEKGAWSLHIIL